MAVKNLILKAGSVCVGVIAEATIPTVQTTSVSDIVGTGATCGGTVTSDGNAPVTARGVCWSESTGPTTSDSKTSDGSGTGSFVSSVTGLTPDTVYYIRAYATNAEGTAYGGELIFTSGAAGASASEIVQNGITITLDDVYEVGQYVNGDWWFVGAADVTAISQPHSTAGRDGAMVNPTNGSHGYDDRISGYSSALDVTRHLPYSMSPGDSLVCSVSWELGETGCPGAVGGKPRPTIRRMIVVTCEASAPAATAFRPSYAGSTKVSRDSADLQWVSLPDLTPPTPANVPSLVTMQGYVGNGPWIDHFVNWPQAEYLPPTENKNWYGVVATGYYADCVLAMISDAYTDEQKTETMIDLVQIGIDNYGVALNGGSWINNGGINHGRKFPIVFAGFMLNDSDMMGVGNLVHFQEDDQTFYIASGDVAQARWDVDYGVQIEVTGTARAGGASTIQLAANAPVANGVIGLTIETTGGTGSGQTRTITDYDYAGDMTATVDTPWGTQPDATTTYAIHGYVAADIGNPEYGIRHADFPKYDDPVFREKAYRFLNGQCLAGYILCVLALSLKTAWNHDELFDYADRYIDGEGLTGTNRILSTFAKDMWDTFRGSY